MSESTSYPLEKGVEQLLIASALEPELCRRLVESPEEVFAEFDLTEEQKDILRQRDHRLLGLLGAAVVRQFASSSSSSEDREAASSDTRDARGLASHRRVRPGA